MQVVNKNKQKRYCKQADTALLLACMTTAAVHTWTLPSSAVEIC